jgi:hypothetical protein
MISILHNWLFIHIQRTAGNSVQSILARYSEDQLVAGGFRDGTDRFEVRGPYTAAKHFRMQDYADAVPPEIFAKLFKFTVVRNPWMRAISWYFTPLRWISEGRQPRWSADEFRQSLEYMPSMAAMLKVNEVLCPLDMVLRFETLQSDFTALAVALDLEAGAALPHRNKGVSPEYWLNYYIRSPDLVDLVAEHFAEDIQTFGYHLPRVPRTLP